MLEGLIPIGWTDWHSLRCASEAPWTESLKGTV